MTAAEQQALLRRYEPVIRFTRGEHFFPMDVGPYVDRASLWVHYPGEEPELLVPGGKLDIERLGEPLTVDTGGVLFLKSVDPLTIGELAGHRFREVRRKLADGHLPERFHAQSGRLARVGYFSRFSDTLFSISLLTRGRITGDTATAAVLAYRDNADADIVRHRYYGRAVRMDRWIVLQYWFFYSFNNWRSGFFGFNDHEGDWEMITIFLRDTADGQPEPAWIAYASHDFTGDDLRRRWDDPEVEKIGDHPVVYAGAGSHASYFLPGEYLTEIELPFLARSSIIISRVKEFWERMLKREHMRRWRTHSGTVTFRIPFVDYARGNGTVIGPGQEREWEAPVILDPPPPWARNYRGLWGLYALDPLSGENAPAGPLYNRDGTMRTEWIDPVSWCGLNKVPPPGREIIRLNDYRSRLEVELGMIEDDIQRKTETLQGMELAGHALRGQPHLDDEYDVIQADIDTAEREILGMRKRQGTVLMQIDTIEQREHEFAEGKSLPSRAHLRRPHYPTTADELTLSNLAEIWAAVSTGLVMIGMVLLFFFAHEYLETGLAVLIGSIILIDAVFRRRWHQFISMATIALSIFVALILLFEFFRGIVIAAVILVSGYIMIQNLRELWD